jgi:hypothetical protein
MRKLIALLLLVMFAARSYAQEDSNTAKIDSILYYQKRINDLQTKVYDETARYKEPLAGRSFGIEFNPSLFVISAANSFTALSGGVSLFNIDRRAEIIFPFSAQFGTSNRTIPLTVFSQDAVYRRFLGQHQDGFYLSTGLRYTYLSGNASSSVLFGDPLGRETRQQIGLMFGIGYRYFSYSGFYWGVGIMTGSYFGPRRETYIDGTWPFTSEKLIFDIELLKFGFAF